MSFSQQRLHSLNITKLKNIHNLSFSFEPKNLTGILGPNGCGKSTILHALACCFQPKSGDENYKFSNFFIPHPDALWEGSALRINHTFRQKEILNEKVDVEYNGLEFSDRWLRCT